MVGKTNLNTYYFKALALLLAVLLTSNISFISTNGWARLFWNSLGYLLLFLVYRLGNLSLDDIGLTRAKLKSGLKYAAGATLVILGLFLFIFLIDKTVFQDPRYHHSLSTALFAALVLLPLKTVLFEELAFRGILPALLIKAKYSQRLAAAVSALLFGFWHIFSATKIGDYDVSGQDVSNFLVIIGVFIATSVAGYVLYELRQRSGSLLAPIIVHWSINASALVLASLSWL